MSDDASRQRMQVVGVVADAYYSNIRVMLPVVFVPMHSNTNPTALAPLREATFVVRTSSNSPLASLPSFAKK